VSVILLTERERAQRRPLLEAVTEAGSPVTMP
jgi:hypothetical protein